ncbi:hypothetical protein D4764_09G0000480 [Takifugu flavidus]|uniref:Uncharacterized protein n=1 Tax=Takifugu flavidus TaxID=433684 RepID=A0A5C6MJP1_9TELE|nr:hypothetical protein D4764_09G0000480 [Takifugu flavidus]
MDGPSELRMRHLTIGEPGPRMDQSRVWQVGLERSGTAVGVRRGADGRQLSAPADSCLMTGTLPGQDSLCTSVVQRLHLHITVQVPISPVPPLAPAPGLHARSISAARGCSPR